MTRLHSAALSKTYCGISYRFPTTPICLAMRGIGQLTYHMDISQVDELIKYKCIERPLKCQVDQILSNLIFMPFF